nr:hypothetical protein [Tanacetum cinerariifolium]
MEVFIEHPVDNYVMDTIDLEQEDASAGLGDENVGNLANDLGDENVENVSNDLRDENVEEFDPLFSYPHMQTDNNEESDHNERSDNNEGSDHNEGSDNNEGEVDLEDFDSEIDNDDDEAERRKALRKLVRTRRELHLTRNDKERVSVECRGIVPCFSNIGPNKDRLVDGPSG